MEGANTTESYSYDPVGNRLSSLGASYTVNTSNEATAAGGVMYTYDNNGNTTSKTNSAGTTSYARDFENRLITVTLPGQGGTITFKYDPFGRRIYKSSSSGTTIYAYDGDNVVETTDQNGGILSRLAQGQNIDEPLAESTSGATSYYEADGLGSITSLTNGAGSVAQTYTYDSFGSITHSTGSLTNPFQYTRREFDSETELYYYRARYYDPSAGRFPSEDSVKFAQGVNFYQYVGNEPLLSGDPYGHGIWDCLKCLYYQRQCLNNGLQCRRDLDNKYPDPLDLCSATNSPSPGDAYFKVCFASQPSCQKAISSCAKCGLWPPALGGGDRNLNK